MKKQVFGVALVCLSATAQAVDFDYAVGITVEQVNLSYEDGDGSTDDKSVTFPFRLYGEINIDTVNNLVVGWRAVDFDIDATTDGDMGATFEGYQIDAVWLHQVRLGRDFKPWFGLGLRTSVLDVKGKHTVDSDGYLLERFQPTSETQLSGMFQAYYDWKISRSGWFVSTYANYDMPIGDGLESLGVGVGLKLEL